MEMFDVVDFDAPSPPGTRPGVNYETWGLGRDMDRYTVTAAGRLVLHEVRYEPLPEEERASFGMFGATWPVEVGDRDMAFDGELVLYGDGTRLVARFIDGTLKSIGPDQGEGAGAVGTTGAGTGRPVERA